MKINYRPEIDGLRAIAVVAVIIYHAEINLFGYDFFKGGFLGVDIFFVISGYLITSIILKELNYSETFSFYYFYERRIRRIIPVLVFVIILSIPFAWISLTPVDFVDFAKSIAYSLGFSSNLYFYFSGQEYSALNGLYKPFLHTWSLSVEEQYYLFFPILLFFSFKYFKKYLLSIFLFLIISSIIFSEIGSKNFSSLNFYILPSRIWEILLGSLVAYQETFNNFNTKKNSYKIFPLLGFSLILISFVYFDHSVRHPSIITLIPILGVILIICFIDKKSILNKILSSKIFVGTGLISYSLYLWHYPIFAFARITEITSGEVSKKIIMGFAIITISIFSYFFIEKPFRNKKIKFNKILSGIIFLILIVVIFVSFIIYNEGYKSRMPKNLQTVVNKESHKLLENSNKQQCLQKKDGCKFNLSSNRKVFLVGDSHAAALGFDLKDRIIKKNFSFTTYLMGACGFFPGFNLVEKKSEKIDKDCNVEYFASLRKKLLENSNSIIIFHASMPLYLDKNDDISWKQKYKSNGKFESLSESFKNIINELSQNNKILLIYPVHEVGINVNRKLLNNHIKNLFKLESLKADKIFSTPIEEYFNFSKSTFELFDSIKNKNIYRIYPHKVFCNTILKNSCASNDKENIFYFDETHLSLAGSKKVNDMLMKKFELIINK